MSYAKIRPRRGTLYEWSTTNPVLFEGEIAIEYPDTGIGSGLCKIKIGNGYSKYNNLAYALDGEAAASINGGGVDVYHTIQLRAATTNDWMAADPVLQQNEIVYDISAVSLKVGNGVSKFSELPYIGGASSAMELDFGSEDDY